MGFSEACNRGAARSHGISPEYVAGVVDSDGSLFITTYPSPRSKLGYVFVVAVQLGLAESEASRGLLEYLKKKYGGNIQTQPSGRGGRKTPLLVYALRHGRASRLILDIYPYLLLKRTQANLCIKALEIQAIPPRERHFNWSNMLQSYREVVSRLNSKKGQHAIRGSVM